MFILALIPFCNSFAFQKGVEKSDPDESEEVVFDDQIFAHPLEKANSLRNRTALISC